MKKNLNLVRIVTQAFYGNRVETEIELEELDHFILGHQDNSMPLIENVDRTIINVPSTNNIVIIYNKYQENRKLKLKEKLLKEENYELKPLAVIPEENIEIYSRCIVCRMNENGEIESLQNEDFGKFMKYLAE